MRVPSGLWEPDGNTAEAHPLATHPFLLPQPLPWLHALKEMRGGDEAHLLGTVLWFSFFPMASAYGH